MRYKALCWRAVAVVAATLFAIAPARLAHAQAASEWALSTIWTFGGNADVAFGINFVQNADGNFYGIAETGGDQVSGLGRGAGSIAKMTPSGQVSALYFFSDASDGCYPQGSLALGTDGNYYGVTANGGGGPGIGDGTVFKVTTSGRLTTIYAFSWANE